MPGKVRRIVTGHNAEGKSVIVSDTQLPPGELVDTAVARIGMWTTTQVPASNTTPDPCPDGVIAMVAPQVRGGTVFRITDFPPEREHPRDPTELAARGAHVSEDRLARHPGFHLTNTIDYAICLEGEIWAVLDEVETLMRVGDVLIQRGTYHAWSNRSDRVCRMAFILIDAEPVEAS
jgi:hypothetical protein